MDIKKQVEGCVANDSLTQEFVFNKHSSKLMGICSRYFDRLEDAEDSLTEAFILIFGKIKQYKGGNDESIFFSWMKKISINVCLTKIRKEKKNKLLVSLENNEFYLSEKIVVENDDPHGAKELLKIIHELPEGFRTVFNLFAIEGYSHKEIGQMLNISEGTSKSQYSRAKNYLRVKLEKIGITNSLVEA